MNVWGVAIPGLAMRAEELPDIPGLLRLENPEIGNGVRLTSSYTLEDVAELHLKSINELSLSDSKLSVIGFSLGAAVAQILASRFRSLLPAQTTFRFLAPTLNTESAPAAPDELIVRWKDAEPGNVDVYRRLLVDFFSTRFQEIRGSEFETYVKYRALGENLQSDRAFRRQTAALRSFRGSDYICAIDPQESLFMRGAEDKVFPPQHMNEIIQLLPQARVREIEGAGHMLHLEAPWVFAAEQVE